MPVHWPRGCGGKTCRRLTRGSVSEACIDIVIVAWLSSLQIGSHVNDLALGDAELFPVFKACADLGAAVFIHPWDMPASPVMAKYWMPW